MSRIRHDSPGPVERGVFERKHKPNFESPSSSQDAIEVVEQQLTQDSSEHAVNDKEQSAHAHTSDADLPWPSAMGGANGGSCLPDDPMALSNPSVTLSQSSVDRGSKFLTGHIEEVCIELAPVFRGVLCAIVLSDVILRPTVHAYVYAQYNHAMATAEENLGDSLAVVRHIPKDILLVIFIHGFKGTDSTFGSFPSRLEHILTETTSNVIVECIVFPAYETKGELNAAVERFADWLTTLTVQKEVANGGGAGVAKIVLCGHRQNTPSPQANPPLPQITAAGEPTDMAASSGWARWAPAAYAVGGAVAAGAAAGAAYWRREELTSGYNWASDHMKYVGNLWDEEAMKGRLDSLVQAGTKHGILFKTFYVLLPPSSASPSPRTFVVLPPRSSPVLENYIVCKNTVASDEVQAHMGMFEPSQNDGYYELGLETAKMIREVAVRNGIRSSEFMDMGRSTETSSG
ncbi:hypothetical protein ID866_2553 [Astraeus odoratus]|nr:hypothetical protein ID866_2553 [Astraeus odoratus]